MKRPSKKQTAFTGFLMILLIVGAYIVGFVGWGSPGSISVNKTASCTITVSTFCSVAQTYSPTVFKTIPQVVFTGDMLLPVVTSSVLDDFCFVCPESGVGVTWANMPSGSTPVEIFGDTNYQHQVILNDQISRLASYSSFLFYAWCSVASNNATAVLRPQISGDQGVTWSSLSSTVTGADLNIGTGCPTGGGFQLVSPISNINVPIGNGLIILRIVGLNGGGLGDAPVIQKVAISLMGSATVPARVFSTVRTLTGFTANCIVPIVVSSLVCIMPWRAKV